MPLTPTQLASVLAERRRSARPLAAAKEALPSIQKARRKLGG